jgi:hypothetical protein
MMRSTTQRPRDLFDAEEPPTVLSSDQRTRMRQLIQAMLIEVFTATARKEADDDEGNA